jgi:hypothetical protein
LKIIHNIVLSVTEQEKQEFRKVGIELELGFTAFQIQEDDVRWPAVNLLVDKFSAVDTARTVFSSSECKQAKYLGMLPSWHYGYPMPDDDFGYLQGFDLREYCARCGIGLKQLTPFRMKKAPPWGNRSIVQLNWVFDEFFVKPETWTNVFKAFGIECLPVILHRDGTVLGSILQLKMERVIELDMGDSPYEQCASCGRKKYLPITRGFWPQPLITDQSALFKSSQYFGSGANAFRLVIAAANLYRCFVDSNLKGITLAPCRDFRHDTLKD